MRAFILQIINRLFKTSIKLDTNIAYGTSQELLLEKKLSQGEDPVLNEDSDSRISAAFHTSNVRSIVDIPEHLIVQIASSLGHLSKLSMKNTNVYFRSIIKIDLTKVLRRT